MPNLSYTPVQVNTDNWIDPMKTKLWQIWAEVRGSEDLTPIFPKMAYDAASTLYERIKDQIRKGQEAHWGDVHLIPCEEEGSRLILPSDKSTEIEYLKAKFERERNQLEYNRNNPFWR